MHCKNLEEAEQKGSLIINQEIFFQLIADIKLDTFLPYAYKSEINEFIVKKQKLQNFILNFLDES